MAPPKVPGVGREEDVTIGNYHLSEVIGTGGFGTVHKALNVKTGKVVAIKRIAIEGIPPEELAGIEGEVLLLQKLSHVNIVTYLETIRTEKHLNIVLEYVENGALSSVVKKFGGKLPESLVALYVQQVLKGLAYLHSEGVIHRDIKGANILATR
ncbi:MAG: hypothetical protein MHM6MM_004071 [Cercozoa sp. M6MM]